MNIKAVFFDLDGTLVDSAPDIAASIDATLIEFGWQPAGLHTLRDWVGNGSKVLVRLFARRIEVRDPRGAAERAGNGGKLDHQGLAGIALRRALHGRALRCVPTETGWAWRPICCSWACF